MPENEERELIVVRQLPIIEEQLQQAKSAIENEVKGALDLVCTADNLKSVRAKRAELNKQFEKLEVRRKQVKSAVLDPYNKFETTYKDCVTNLYQSADKQLKNKIVQVENAIKEEKRDEIETYFNEYVKSMAIPWLAFSMAEITVGLSDSITGLKKKAKAFADKVHDDLIAISAQDHNSEILVEYKKSFNLSNAIAIVVKRHKQIEDEKASKTEDEQQVIANQKAAQKVNEVLGSAVPAPLQPPVEEKEDQTSESKASGDKIYQLTFKVRGTKEKLIDLKTFLHDGGYDYE